MCPDTHRLVSLLVTSSSDAPRGPKQFSLRILRDVNSGRTTRTHAQTVLRELLFQNHFLLNHPTEEFAALIANEASLVAFEGLQLEVLSLLATLAATCPTSTTPLLDCCQYVDEMCTIIRHMNWNCNRKVSLHVARRCLGGMLPLLPKATPAEIEAFKKTLKNCYTERLAEGGGEEVLNFTLMDKIHFVFTVYAPFMILHYCVEPLRRSERNTKIGMVVAMAAFGMLVYNWMHPAVIPTALPAAKPLFVAKQSDQSSIDAAAVKGSTPQQRDAAAHTDLVAKFMAAANEK